jgi:hypothetical protein
MFADQRVCFSILKHRRLCIYIIMLIFSILPHLILYFFLMWGEDARLTSPLPTPMVVDGCVDGCV